MQVTAFNGSPRINGNSTYLLQELLRGSREAGDQVDAFSLKDLHIKECRGCLRCNIIRRCSLRADDWEAIAGKILAADRLVFATPVYFHHVSASLKKIIDRFRSFLQVRMTETGLLHRPWHTWKKEFILLLTMGSSDAADARPIIDLFQFMVDILGPGNSLSVITATRLAVPRQVAMGKIQLKKLYPNLGLPGDLAARDHERNKTLLERCYKHGLQRNPS